ncbi:MAG: hypothetical protein WB797_06290 [Nocardioides sp.]
MHGKEEFIRGEVRHVGYIRVSHGVFRLEKPGLSDNDVFVQELRAWLLVLPAGAVFTHVTGARLRGWRLPPLPEQVPVFAAVHGGNLGPRRPGLNCSRLVDAGGPSEVEVSDSGLPVDSSEEILLRAARDMGHLDLVVMLDSALALGDVDPRRMQAMVTSRRPGVRALRAAYDAARHRAESVGETLLRMFHDVMEVPVEPQVEVRDKQGRLVGRADLLVTGTSSVHEYDGAGHRDKGQHRADLRRERRFAGSAYVRRGYTLDDLLNHPAVAMHELDRLLCRPHQQQRLRRWRRLVDHSMYSEPGRARVMNRWRREMGIVDWARSA